MQDYRKAFMLSFLYFNYENLSEKDGQEVDVFRWSIGLFEEISCSIRTESFNNSVYKMFFRRTMFDKITNESWFYYNYKRTKMKTVDLEEGAFLVFKDFIKSFS